MVSTVSSDQDYNYYSNYRAVDQEDKSDEEESSFYQHRSRRRKEGWILLVFFLFIIILVILIIVFLPKEDFGTDMIVKGQIPAVSSTDIRYGKLTFDIPEATTYKCNKAQFSPPFSKQDVFVQVAPSRSRLMTRSLLQAVTVWLEWTNSSGFSACVETSGPSGDRRVVDVHWLAFQGQPEGSAAGIAEIPFWTTGSSYVEISFPSVTERTVRNILDHFRRYGLVNPLAVGGSQILNPVPEVFVTPIHRFSQERKNAASVWSENVTSRGFKIFLRELINFSGGHKHIRVQWIALVTIPIGWKMPEKSKITFKNTGPPEKHMQYSFCENVSFKKPFYQTPVLLLSPSHKWNRENVLSVSPENNAITSWVENLDTVDFTVCVKDMQPYEKHHDPITVQYIAFGDIDPCFNVECSYYAKCKAFGPKNATCVCDEEIPSYEEEVCSEEDVTYQNSFSLEQDLCLKGRRIRITRPGSCQPFLVFRGRTYVFLGNTEAQCSQVTINFMFLAHKPIHVHVAVNYFNTSGQFTHEAAVAWTEDVSPTKFLICALTAGRLDRLPPDGGLTFVDFLAYQGNPVGSVTGHEVLPSWWDGTTCKVITLPQDKFSRPPYVLVSGEHTFSGRKHDAATIWASNIGREEFTVCLREMQNFDGLHENITVDWMAFSHLPREMDIDWQNITFNSKMEIESFSGTNYAFFKTVTFDATFSDAPYVIISASHNSHHGNMPQEYNSIATWVENINALECRVCMKELHSPYGYDSVTITLVAIGPSGK